MGGRTWQSEEQSDWLEDQLDRYIDAQQGKSGQTVGQVLTQITSEFFGIWKKPSEEMAGTYAQPKRVRKDKPMRQRKVYTDNEYETWFKDRKKVRTQKRRQPITGY